jgi:hypothetical protein
MPKRCARRCEGNGCWWRVARRVRAGTQLLRARDWAGCAAAMAVICGLVAAVHASGAATDALVVQADLDGAGDAAAERLELLLEPIPSFMRSLTRSLSHIAQRVTHED